MILVDTTFLIDLQRPSRNERHLAAAGWLQENANVEIALPAIALGEFVEGFESDTDPVIEHYRASHQIIGIDDSVAMTYARISRELRKTGKSIGSNDTWIAATALANHASILTRNISYFNRVSGLEVLGYG